MKAYKIDREQKYKTSIIKMYEEGLSRQYISNVIYNQECKYRNLKRKAIIILAKNLITGARDDKNKLADILTVNQIKPNSHIFLYKT